MSSSKKWRENIHFKKSLLKSLFQEMLFDEKFFSEKSLDKRESHLVKGSFQEKWPEERVSSRVLNMFACLQQ